jgi:hypothetical protein
MSVRSTSVRRRRLGWDGTGTVAQQLATLDAVAKQRSAEAAGAAPVYVPYVPAVATPARARDLQESVRSTT